MSHAAGPPPTPTGPDDVPRTGPPRISTATATLLSLVVILVVGVIWGFSALTAPFGDSATGTDAAADDGAACPAKAAAGRAVRPREVVVSVLNAGTRRGRAAEIMGQLADQGFRQGVIGNAPAGVEVGLAEVWTSRPTAAATRLVRSTLPSSTRVRPVPAGVEGKGVILVVGDGLGALSPASTSITALTAAPACADGS